MSALATRLPNSSHALRIGRTELVRRWRASRDKPAKLVGLGLAGLFGVVFLLAAVAGAYFAGRALANGDIDRPLWIGRTVVAGVWVFATFITAFRVVAKTGSVAALDGLLTTVPPRDVAAGLLLAEVAPGAGVAAVPVVLAAVVFAVGAGSVVVAPLAFVALACVVVLGLVTGVTVGFGLQALITWAPVLSEHRSALGLVAMLAYMGLLFTNSFNSAFQPLVAAARVSPVGWFADLVLLPFPAAAVPAAGVAALVATPVLVAAAFLLSGWFATLTWYADPKSGGGVASGRTRNARGTGALGLVGSVGLPRSTVRVASKNWLRTLRAPIKVIYAVYPLFLLIQPARTVVETGSVPVTLPALVAFYCAWTTGAAFALNPFGDEGAVLPVTLTTPVTGRDYVGGLVLSGVAIGAPVTALLAFVTGFFSPLSLVQTVATAVGGVLVCAAAGSIAAAAGTAFPRFDAASVTRSRKAVVPSTWAFVLYSVTLGVLWLPSTLLQLPFVAGLVADPLGVAPSVVSAAGLVVALALVAASGLLSFRYAARSFDTYTL